MFFKLMRYWLLACGFIAFFGSPGLLQLRLKEIASPQPSPSAKAREGVPQRTATPAPPRLQRPAGEPEPGTGGAREPMPPPARPGRGAILQPTAAPPAGKPVPPRRNRAEDEDRVYDEPPAWKPTSRPQPGEVPPLVPPAVRERIDQAAAIGRNPNPAGPQTVERAARKVGRILDSLEASANRGFELP